MRRARVKVNGSAYYHVMSRCALQQFLLTGDAREMFLKILRRAELFSGVKIVNYCVMDNHFHLLVHVPEKQEVSDEELEDRIRILYGPDKTRKIIGRWDALAQLGLKTVIERERAAYRKRMYDLSEFMKTFKQRFSLWYCSNHGNLEGTIWQGPFHSVLIEGRHDALGAVSTYITLNPVRAKLVTRPEEYRWSAYGAAAAGDRRVRSALLSTYGEGHPVSDRWKAHAAMIKTAMAESGDCETAPRAEAVSENRNARLKDTSSWRVEDTSGAKTGNEMRVRNRDISRGVAFGSKGFVLAAILSARNTEEVRTTPKAFCFGEKRMLLYCAGRRGA